MIIHSFMWSYEREAVEISIKNLCHVVDYVVAVQATNTFRGHKREVSLLNIKGVTDIVVTIPNGLDPWESEKWLRDQTLIEAYNLFGDKCMYMISDGDEIPNSESIKEAARLKKPTKLMTDYRNFYADWRASDHILEHQPTVATYQDYMTVGGAGNARWHSNWTKSKEFGWHLSSLGNVSHLKLETFAHTEYDTEEYKKGLDESKKNHMDFLNRFKLEYTTDIPKGIPDNLLGGRI